MKARYKNDNREAVLVTVENGDVLFGETMPGVWEVHSDKIGELIDYLNTLGLTIADPDPPPVVVDLGVSIRDWQFFRQLAAETVISAEEALATNGGVMPKLLTDAIKAEIADPADQLTAAMKVGSTTTFYRRDPLVGLVASYITSLGTFGTWDDARLDKLWEDAGKLA